MANRPKENRAEQDKAPNFKMIKPAEGGIHAAVGAQINRADQEGGSVLQPNQGQPHGR
jgi:hypothetical protein